LQDVDSAGRRAWMGVLARAPLGMLEAWAAKRGKEAFTWLRPPETGLVMVRARAGGTGGKFNLGEMTVTRCALRLANGPAGVAYVPGRSHRKAELAALADALLQHPDARAEISAALIEPLRMRQEAEAGRMHRKAQATRVEFFTVAREAGA
jgi:alpha-D-ribose 1-methylphosphonate 5-triphosphate synthase subunit PhnG